MGKSVRHGITAGMLVGGGGTVFSRVTGLVRDICFARFGGTGELLGAFLVAFTVPNLFRRLFGEGALSEAAIPVFNEVCERDGRVAAFRLVNEVISVAVVVLSGIVAIGIGAVLALRVLVPGTMGEAVLNFVPWLLPYTLFVCVAGFLAGVLNSLGHFAVPAYAPAILNVLFILAVTVAAPLAGETPAMRSRLLVVAVLAAGVLQLGCFAPVLKRYGYRFRFRPAFGAPRVRRVARLMGPLVLGASVYQLNTSVDRVIATCLGGGAVTSLYYGERLVYLPVGVFAVALSAACLPAVSRAAAAGDAAAVADAVVYSLRHVLFLALPCTLVLLFLGVPIIEVAFRRGRFDANSLALTHGVLLFYAPGIPAFAAAKIVRTGFIGRRDARTPVVVGTIFVVVNLVLNLLLIGPLRQRGLALATTVCAYAALAMLSVRLVRDLRPPPGVLRPLGISLLRLAVATSLAAAAVMALRGAVPGWCGGLGRVIVPAAGAGVVYVAATLLAGGAEPGELLAVIGLRLSRR